MNGLFLNIDWQKSFALDMPLLEIFIRGSVVYFILLVLLRALRKQFGGISMPDVLLIVILGNAAQNAMVADTVSITTGILLVAVIVFWNFVLDFLGYQFPLLRKFIHPDPRLLVKDGKYLIPNMRHEFISKEELASQLREHGINNLADVKEVYLEGDGHVSVIKKK